MNKSFTQLLLEAYKEIPLSVDVFHKDKLYSHVYAKANGATRADSIPKYTENHFEVGMPHFTNDIPPDHKNAIQKYTDDSTDVNNNLWRVKLDNNFHTYTNKLKEEDQPELNYELGLTVDKALSKFPEAKEDFHVFTGLGHKSIKGFLENNDEYVHVPSFTSTSLNPYVSKTFTSIVSGRHILRIKIRKGQQVGGYIQPLSSQAAEEEFLIKPNQILKINKTPNTFTDEHGRQTHVYDTHILTNDEINQLPHDNQHVQDYHKIARLIK